MKKVFKTVGLSGVLRNSSDDNFLKAVLNSLEDLNINVLCDQDLVNKGKNLKRYLADDGEIILNSDLLISVGGDGTMLKNAKKYGIKGIPLLGINLGTLGFLTDVETEDLGLGLKGVLKGKYILDDRFFLQAFLGSKKLDSTALNEIVLHSGAVAKMIEYNLFIDKRFVYNQKADGVIVFTPTGSTAYSLSGGGPIVDPDLNVTGIVPMFPHSINTTPIIIDDKKEVRIELTNSSSNKSSELSFDSQENLELEANSIVTISKSKDKVSLVHPLDNDFFSRCRTKLGWGKSIT